MWQCVRVSPCRLKYTGYSVTDGTCGRKYTSVNRTDAALVSLVTHDIHSSDASLLEMKPRWLFEDEVIMLLFNKWLMDLYGIAVCGKILGNTLLEGVCIRLTWHFHNHAFIQYVSQITHRVQRIHFAVVWLI